MIFGIPDALRKHKLCDSTVDNIEDKNDMLILQIPETKTYKPKSFIITDNFYNIYKKYAILRPVGIETKRFFISYHNGKCSKQVIGINTIGSMPKTAATYLNLNKLETYTGHTFRRT